jgi:type IV secretory pathway VirD2 relaxase
MAQMEKDLGTRLEWVAVDHYNTGHPHTHIMLRGKDDRSENLVISPEYISHGMRERAMRIATLDLGPRTELEIEQRQRSDIDAERLTSIDRQLVKTMDVDHIVQAGDPDPFRQTLRAGRLQKLGRMGLAEHLEGDRWRLTEGLEDTLCRIGERGVIIRTMQRELSARSLERPAADHVIFDAAVPDAKPIVGRLVARGLADENRDTHHLIIDGVDGRTHYVAIGKGDVVEPITQDAIVRVEARVPQLRDVDRTIAAVAAASYGKYSSEAHLLYDPRASEEFIATHVRRLEAMRRLMREPERDAGGTWTIGSDHLDKVAAYERRQVIDRPVTVEVLSAIPIERLPGAEAATWLDRELVAAAPIPIRDAGFGKEVASAQAARRQWLVAQQLAQEEGGQTVYRSNLLAALRRRELLRSAGGLSSELGLSFSETSTGERVEGRFVRRVDLVSGRFALIERSRDFTLVPWRPVLEYQVGKQVSGVMREEGPSWTIGRQRSGPTIT